MKKVTYISLDKKVLLNGIGGASHIKGVLRTLISNFKVGYIGHATNLLSSMRGELSFYECGRWFFWDLIKAIVRDKDSDFFVIRKTLLGMYILVPIILFKKMRGSKQKYILEFNGISGDYSGRSHFFMKTMLFVNVFPLPFYDGVYCVLKDISDRLKSVYNSDKIFVCPNGGPDQSNLKLKVEEKEQVYLIYYGSNLSHYHLQWVSSTLDDYNVKKKSNVKLILIGPNNDAITGKCLEKLPPKSIDDFQKFVASLTGKAFGLIPLNSSKSSNTIEPIKTFDYFSSNIPIIHSSSCLNGFSCDYFCFKYKTDDPGSFCSLIDEVVALPTGEFEKLCENVCNEYLAFTWPVRLEKLVEVISSDVKKDD